MIIKRNTTPNRFLMINECLHGDVGYAINQYY